jgi:gamma-glutamylcyclotransferase (GGCT)/AIG2-like uncharacterized protein YtfP
VRVFVYGTLMYGEPNQGWLRGAPLVGCRHTAPRYMLVSLGPYPAMRGGGTTSVAGELYEVDDTALHAVDRFEGVPTLYRRVPVLLSDGECAQAYLLARPRAALRTNLQRLERVPIRIEVVGDGHVFQGTPKQILMQMKSLAFGSEHMTTREYIEGNVANISRAFNIHFKLQGDTDEELAESFLIQMIDGGYAKKL